MGRPATGQTPVHSVRVPPHVWDEAERGLGDGGTMSALIVRLLERHNAAQRRPPRDR